MNIAPIVLSAYLWLSVYGVIGSCLQNGGSEATPNMIDRIGLRPPDHVTMKWVNRRWHISWSTSPIQRIVGYEVYRRSSDQKTFEAVKRVKEPCFIDYDSKSKDVKYAVSAVDYRGNQSELSKAVVIDSGQKE